MPKVMAMIYILYIVYMLTTDPITLSVFCIQYSDSLDPMAVTEFVTQRCCSKPYISTRL